MDGQARRAAFLSQTTRTVRKVLAERWPSVRFEVAARPTASWTRFDVHWQDGPTRLMVGQVVEATAAALATDPDLPAIEVNTRRTLSEDGVAAALRMAVDTPPAQWFAPNGDVTWVRLGFVEARRLEEELTLPERPASAHHLAALLANRIDLTLALSLRGY